MVLRAGEGKRAIAAEVNVPVRFRLTGTGLVLPDVPGDLN